MSYQVTRVPVETNHVLHLILTLVTCFLWAPVWLIVWIINANSTKNVTTQTYGPPPVYNPGQAPAQRTWNHDSPHGPAAPLGWNPPPPGTSSGTQGNC